MSAELKAREQAERIARDSEDSLCRLTGRLLQLPDAERRKFSRELHDSLGQYLVGVKMHLEAFATERKNSLLVEAVQLSTAETWTISRLLHPSLLDESGLSSAGKWYLEGFAQRSGIEVKADRSTCPTMWPPAQANGAGAFPYSAGESGKPPPPLRQCEG